MNYITVKNNKVTNIELKLPLFLLPKDIKYLINNINKNYKGSIKEDGIYSFYTEYNIDYDTIGDIEDINRKLILIKE